MKTPRAGSPHGPSWGNLFLQPLLVLALLSLSAAGRAVDLLTPWNIYLENTASASHRDNAGDTRLSIFPAVGVQAFNHTYLGFDRRWSDYESLSGYAGVLLNDDFYRASVNATILEQAQLLWEKGDTPVPFRLHLGDHFGFLSKRTLQHVLKGVQLELLTPNGCRSGAFGGALRGPPVGCSRLGNRLSIHQWRPTL